MGFDVIPKAYIGKKNSTRVLWRYLISLPYHYGIAVNFCKLFSCHRLNMELDNPG